MLKIFLVLTVTGLVVGRPQNFAPRHHLRPGPQHFPLAHVPNTTPIPPPLPVVPTENIPVVRPQHNTKTVTISEAEYQRYKMFEDVQNKNAKYEFSSNVEDHINDQTQTRDEVRDGAAVRGMYSYSDGYVKRTVHYMADENGFRVTGEEVTPLDGPNVDLNGSASVSQAAHGQHVSYKIQSVPYDGPVPKILDPVEYVQKEI